MIKQRVSFFLITIIAFSFALFLAGFIKVGNKKLENVNDWKQELIKFRDRKDREFKTFPDSPMSRSKRLAVLPGDGEAFILETPKDLILSKKKQPNAKISILHKNKQWHWNCLETGITCKLGDKTITPGTPLKGKLTFKLKRCVLTAYAREDRLLLMVHDPQRPEFKDFKKLVYFPPAPEFAVPAVLEKFAEIKTFKVRTSQNEEKTYHRYAAIKFKIAGKPYRLTAFKFSMDKDNPNSTYLFIPFSDATSGKETYEVGRFLEIHEPEEKNFTLDFNRNFNPLCNYSPGYNCPIPPLENHLEIPIKAGEKTYHAARRPH
ncbi:MAG: DUF1684 domain-containing protein [bacterium]|nr:DUF1684 domain-containing protein [bacterium]